MSAGTQVHPVDAEFPVNGSPRERLSFAANYATLAPSQFPRQPFELLLQDAHLDLLVRADAAPESDDDDQRALIIECGMALHYVRVAMRHFGCLGRVDYFPDLDQRSLFARVHFGFGRERDANDARQFEALTHRGGGVSADTRGLSPETTLAALCRSAAAERAWLELTRSHASVFRLLEFTLASAPSRPFASPTSALGIVKTKTDDEHGWLAAGQTAARATLQAQASGLPWEFFDQVPHRNAREALRRGIGHKGFAQLILLFGPTTDHTFRVEPSTTSTATFNW